MALSVKFGRPMLITPGDNDLTVSNTPGGDFWVPETGIEWPRFPRRKDRAPAVSYLSGPGALLARVSDLGTFPLTVYAAGADDDEVWDNRDLIQETVDQWSYTLTLTLGSSSRAYTAECVDDEIAWGEIDSGMVRARICRGTVAIPLYP